MKRVKKPFAVLMLVTLITLVLASTAFAGVDYYYGSCSSNFNTSDTLSGTAGQTGYDHCYTANKSSWTSRIYSSNGACQASAMQMAPGAAPSGTLNSKANSSCYLNVKNPGGATLVIPERYWIDGYSLDNAWWSIW